MRKTFGLSFFQLPTLVMANVIPNSLATQTSNNTFNLLNLIDNMNNITNSTDNLNHSLDIFDKTYLIFYGVIFVVILGFMCFPFCAKNREDAHGNSYGSFNEPSNPVTIQTSVQ